MIHPATRLRELETRARRRFGQNFLVAPDSAERIVTLARVRAGDRVLEIGPGLGTLTEALRDAGAQLVCVELDRDLAAGLRELWPDLTLVEGDAMRVPLAQHLPGGGWKAVANLPYNVGTPILMRLLGMPGTFSSLTLMFQREVGDRLAAAPGDSEFGALSVQVQVRAEVSRLLTLPPGAFHPPPKIWSSVLGFRLFAEPDFGGVPAATFDRVVRLGFQHRRKTLANSLSAGLPRDVVATVCAEAGVDPQLRAQVLGVPEWRRLAAAVHRITASEPV
jgi:16S rRNA (adenine1518-N6/adenine1519-N6)-dimethyltransferase